MFRGERAARSLHDLAESVRPAKSTLPTRSRHSCPRRASSQVETFTLTHPSLFLPLSQALPLLVSPSSQVEIFTLTKSANLVLNVDGCIGAGFLDLLSSSGCFTEKEADEIVSIG